MNCVEQRFVVEGFVQERDGPRLQCQRSGLGIGTGGNENDGHRFMSGSQVALQLQPIHSRQAHIEDEAGRMLGLAGLEEVLRGGAIASMPFEMRLSTTCWSSILSPSTAGRCSPSSRCTWMCCRAASGLVSASTPPMTSLMSSLAFSGTDFFRRARILVITSLARLPFSAMLRS